MTIITGDFSTMVDTCKSPDFLDCPTGTVTITPQNPFTGRRGQLVTNRSFTYFLTAASHGHFESDDIEPGPISIGICLDSYRAFFQTNLQNVDTITVAELFENDYPFSPGQISAAIEAAKEAQAANVAAQQALLDTIEAGYSIDSIVSPNILLAYGPAGEVTQVLENSSETDYVRDPLGRVIRYTYKGETYNVSYTAVGSLRQIEKV